MASDRLRDFEPDELDDEQRAFYAQYLPGGERAKRKGAFPLIDAAGHLVGPTKAWLLNPAFANAYLPLGGVVRTKTSLSPRAQEIAILVVAQRLDSPFERFAHEAEARSLAMSADDIEALSTGRAISFADPEEQLSYELAIALMDRGGLTDDEYARAVDQLGETGLFELTGIIGWYQMIGLQLSVFRIMPPG